MRLQIDYFLLHLILTCKVKEEQVIIISIRSELRLSEKSSFMYADRNCGKISDGSLGKFTDEEGFGKGKFELLSKTGISRK